MKVFDKNNKLNIDFENDSSPDIELWKDQFGSHVKIGDQIFGDKVQVTKLHDYLYQLEIDEYTDKDIQEWLKDYKPGACSGIRKGNFYARSYDWNYSNTSSILIHIPAKDGRHESYGIANNDQITKAVAENNDYVEAYRIIPYFTLDGMNDAGVVCSINVVPMDKGFTKGTNPGARDLCQMCMPRIILDYADSALDGVKKLYSYNIWSIAGALGSEIHMMVADKNATYIVEFINNKMVILSDQDDEYDDIPNNEAIMTNFHLSGWDGNVKAVFLGDTEAEVRATGIEDHPEGLERYTILQNSTITDIDSALSAINDVIYTKAYSDTESPLWYSECTGTTPTFGELTVYSKASDFTGIRAKMKEMYENRDRNNPNTWQSVHQSAYDLVNKIMKVQVQEDTTHTFQFTFGG